MNNLFALYNKEILPSLMKDLGIDNIMAVPKLVKIVIHCSIGAEALKDKKVIERMSEQLGMIAGQKPVVTKAKRAISTFKLREGDPIGIKITLRGERMYDFLVKLVGVALPRVRDFSGIPLNGFDGVGNYTLGIKDQSIFPEIEYARIDKTRGFEVTFATSAKTNIHAEALLTKLGLPFEKKR